MSLFGLIDTNLQRYSASGAASLNRMGTDGLSSSRWGLRGTESLGDGMSASHSTAGRRLQRRQRQHRFNQHQ